MEQALFMGVAQKFSFLNELSALPQNERLHIVDKIRLLCTDPFPDGKLKKKLKSQDDLYRLRVGKYRVIYKIDRGWVTLLSVRHRDVAYRTGLEELDDDELNLPAGAGSESLPPDTQGTEDAATVVVAAESSPTREPAKTAPAETESLPLPKPLTPRFLEQLGIPAEYHAVLAGCRTEDDLLFSEVPENWLQRILDVLYPRSLTELEQEPDFVLQDPSDLERYQEGELIAFLLRLDPEQEKVADAGTRGPAMIRGGPGTGKSTVALYRIRALLDRAQARALPQPRILFTTYTNALVRYSEQLLEQLLGPRAEAVTVLTADHLAKEFVTRHLGHDLQMAETAQCRSVLQEILASFRPPAQNDADMEKRLAFLRSMRPDYLLYEFEWIIDGRGLDTLEQYLKADRTGREIPFPVPVREAVWQLYLEYRAAMQKKGLSTWGSVHRQAMALAGNVPEQNKYDYVVIDEAQDLAPAVLAFLVALARDPAGLYLTADAGQSLYSRGFTWQKVNESLRFTGRSAVLRRNYRTTQQIAEAAFDFLLRSGASHPDTMDLSYVLSGECPFLLDYSTDEEQWRLAAEFIKAMSRRWRVKPSSAAVLAPTNNLVKSAAAGLRSQGLAAESMRGTELDLAVNAVKVMTIHSAKGLEFPIVVIPYFNNKFFPQIGKVTDPGEIEELSKEARRKLFVGMTRAMRALLVLHPTRNASPFINELDRDLWNTTPLW